MAEAPLLQEIDLDDYADDLQGGDLVPRAPARPRYRPRKYAQPQFDAADQEFITRMSQQSAPTEPVSNVVTADRGRIDRSLTLSATMDMPFREAYSAEPALTPIVQAKEPGFFNTAGESFMRGIGNMYVLAGRAAGLAGVPADQAEVYTDFGRRLQKAYMPRQKPEEFTWAKMVDPNWYATTVAESVPVTLSLVPAAVIGAYGFGTGGALIGLGAFGKTVLAAVGGAAFARSVEAGFEAAGTYEDAIQRGMSEEEANAAAGSTFKANLALTGVDAAQFALAFTPLRVMGTNIPKLLQNRALAAATRFVGVAGIEAGEEATQEAIQQYSLGDPIALTSQMKEASAIGALFGVGIGGAGSVFRGMVDRVESNMKPGMAEEYAAAKQQAINSGADENQATVQALDQIAEQPGGKEFIDKTFKELKDLADGKEVELISQEDMQSEIEGFDQQKFTVGEEVEAEPELISDEVLESILTRETGVEEIFGLEPEAAETEELIKTPVVVASGTIFRGRTHGEAINAAVDVGAVKETEEGYVDREGNNLRGSGWTDLFETTSGRIVDRLTADRLFDVSASETMGRPGAKVSKEFLVSEESYQSALVALKEKTTGLHAGIDPTVLKDFVVIGAYHIERGVKNFAEWSKAMVEQFGEAIKAHLPDIWNKAQATMTAGSDVKQLDPAKLRFTETEQADTAYQGDETQPILVYQDKGGEYHIVDGHHRALEAKRNKTNVNAIVMPEKVFREFEKAGIQQADMFREYARRLGDERRAAKSAPTIVEGKPRPLPASKVKPAIRLTTGQERIAKTIREDVALSAALKKAEQGARIAYRVGTKDATEKAKAEFRDVLIAAKVKAEQFGFREGFKVSEKLTRNELLSAFKDSQKNAEETRKALRDVIQEELPVEEQGKFLDALVSRLTKKKQSQILDRVIDLKERLTKKELIEELGEIQHYKGQIPVEYQRRLQEIVGDINTKNFSPATVQKIRALNEYAGNQNMPSGVSPTMLAKMDAYSHKQASEMTQEELKEVVDLGKHLLAMGRLKMKLKNKYNARQRQVALNKLVASTHNLDLKTSERESAIGTIAKGSQHLYLDTLTPIRVTEMMDGFKQGANTTLAKHVALADKNAQWAIKTMIEGAVEEAAAAGIAQLTPEQEIRIMINIRAQEGAGEAVQSLMDRYGILEFPKLNPQEEKLIGILQKYMTAHVDDIAALYEETQNIPFVKQPNYILPLKYEGETRISPEEAIIHTPFKKTQTQRGFTNVRKKGVQQIPRVDVWGVFEQGINEQLWYLHMQPALDDVRQLVKAKEYVNKAGEVAANWWRDHLDIVARRGWSAKADHNPFAQALRLARGNITKAMLGYKLSSIIMQPFAVFDSMTYAVSQYGVAAARDVVSEFAKFWIIPGYAKGYESKAAQLRKGGEVAIEETLQKIGHSQKAIDRFVKGGLVLLQKADVRTAAAAQKAFQGILEKHGVANAKEEAAILMDLTSSSSDVSFRPHILSRGEGARTWFTFQTFMLNRWGMVAHDLVTKGIVKGDFKKKIWASVGLGMMVASKLAEDEAREYMYQMILRRKLPERSTLQDALLAIPSNVPVFGGIYETVSRRTSEIPIVKIMSDLMRVALIPTMKPEARAKAALRATEAAAVLTVGAPGTAQAFDLVEGVLFPDKKSERSQAAVKPKMAKAE